MCGKTCMDKLSNERIVRYLGTTPIDDKNKESQLTRYNRFMRRCTHNTNDEVSRLQIFKSGRGVDGGGIALRTWVKAVWVGIIDLEMTNGLHRVL